MKHKLTLLDTCLPDYFNGYHKPVLQVPVWEDITKHELMESIVSEYNMIYEHLTYEDAWPNLSDRQLRTMADEFILTDDPFRDSGLPTLEEIGEDDESIYLYMICEEA